MARPTKLRFTSGYTTEGEPLRFFANIPARDLDEGDIAALDEAAIKNITGGPDPLYVDPDAGKAETKKAGTKKAAPKRAEAPEPGEMTVPELREIAAAQEIPGRSEMNKAELVEAVESTGVGEP